MSPRPSRLHRRRRLAALLAVLLVVAGAMLVWAGQGDGDGDDDGRSFLATLGVEAGLVPAAEGDGGRGGEDGRGGDDGGAAGESSDDGDDVADDEGPGDGGAEGEGSPGLGTLEVVTVADLEPFLVTGADLPIGWIVVDPGPDGSDGLGACIAGPADAVRARVTLQRGSDDAVLSNVVTDHRREEAAVAAFDAAREALVGCIEGLGADARASSVDVAADDSLAVDLTVGDEGASVEGRLVYARVGRRMASVLVLTGVERDDEIADRALAVVAERLRA